MTAVRLLVAEGYPAGARARHRAAGGAEASEVYANLLRELHPGAVVDICYPADPGANFPDAGLEGYDGAVFTGSTLTVYDGGPAVEAQITLARAVLEAGTPVFGSCWGLQVLTVACGGAVHKNPKGREIGFARAVRLTPAGASHPMYRGKAEVFDAVTVHLDEVATLAPGTTVLARNEMSDVQAAEIRTRHASVWATQYHPELSLADMAVIVRRFGSMLVQEGFFCRRRRARRFRPGARYARPQSRDQGACVASRDRRGGARPGHPRQGDCQLDRPPGAADAGAARAGVT